MPKLDESLEKICWKFTTKAFFVQMNFREWKDSFKNIREKAETVLNCCKMMNCASDLCGEIHKILNQENIKYNGTQMIEKTLYLVDEKTILVALRNMCKNNDRFKECLN